MLPGQNPAKRVRWGFSCWSIEARKAIGIKSAHCFKAGTIAAMSVTDYPEWLEIERDEEDDFPVKEYDITASPNDFNVLTIHSFMESGAVKIPGFQRNYVWDIKRASKLIESLIIGLPIPQLFLYEESKNNFLVIDGQQRLMSIYYFIKGVFPRKEKTA